MLGVIAGTRAVPRYTSVRRPGLVWRRAFELREETSCVKQTPLEDDSQKCTGKDKDAQGVLRGIKAGD